MLKRRQLSDALGASLGLGLRRFGTNIGERGAELADEIGLSPTESLDYIKAHGLVGLLGGSAAETGKLFGRSAERAAKDIASSYMAYLNPVLFGARENVPTAIVPRSLSTIKPVTKATAAYDPNAMGDITGQTAGVAPTPQQLAPPKAAPSKAVAAQTPTKLLEAGTLGAMPESSGVQPNKPILEATPFTEGYAGPYNAPPTGQEAAIQMEQKKQGNLDALIVALGDIGASLMGPYQNSWQAELGRTASNMARSRVYASAMEKALAGEIPDDMALGLLTPEQRIQISQVVIQQQTRQLQEREVTTGEKRAATEEVQVRQAGEYQKGTLDISQKELDEKIRQFNIEAPIQAAESKARAEQYKAYAKSALDRVGVAAGKEEDVYKKALDYVTAMGDAYKTMSPEEQGVFFMRVIDSIIKSDFSQLGETTGGGKKAVFNPKTGKIEVR